VIKFYEHPEYSKKKENWQKWHDLYKGDHKTLVSNPDYLWPHTIEEKNIALFESRKRRTRYLEIPEIVISLWTSFFYRNAPEPSDDALDPRKLLPFLEDTDKKGTNFPVFAMKMTEHYLEAGKVGILIDAPTEGSNLEPYASIIHALEIKDWQEETNNSARVGKLNMLRREYKTVLPRTSLQSKPKEVIVSDVYQRTGPNVIEVQRYYKEEQKQVQGVKNQDGEWRLVSEFTLALSEIPMVILEDESWIKGVCEETLRHFNLRSCRDNIQHQQGYTNIFIIGIDAEDTKQVNAISEYTWPILPAGASVTPISPTSTASYDENIAEAMMSAFKVGLNQMRAVASDSKAIQSAESIKAEKDERVALVESTRDRFSRALTEVLNIVAEFKGVQGEFIASLSLEITEENMDEFTQLYMTFANSFRQNPAYDRLAFEKVVKKMFSDSELEELEGLEINVQEEEAQEVETQNAFDAVLEEDAG
jgi:hypothetical protein